MQGSHDALVQLSGALRTLAVSLYKIANNDLTLKQAALKLGFVTEEQFDRVVDPMKMVAPYVAIPS